jgi:hypothetical protein
MTSTSTKIGHGLAKVLGIKLNYRDPTGEGVTRGESAYSVSTADTYVEDEPRSIDWIRSITPSGHDIVNYLSSLFPFIHWITRYNLQWLIGDLVAGRLGICTIIKTITHSTHRHNGWRRCCSAEYGLRQAGYPSSRIWSVLLFHGSIDLLVLCYI